MRKEAIRHSCPGVIGPSSRPRHVHLFKIRYRPTALHKLPLLLLFGLSKLTDPLVDEDESETPPELYTASSPKSSTAN